MSSQVQEMTDASVRNASTLSSGQLDSIGIRLRDSLRNDSLTPSEAVRDVFLWAVEEYPTANVTDIWHYGLYRQYLSFNGGGNSATQSWRNVSGTAFEKFVVSYYNERLPRFLRIEHTADAPEVQDKLEALAEGTDIGTSDIADAVLLGRMNGDWHLFGGVHTMTSFKGRIDSEAEKSLIFRDAGLFSPVVTLDAMSLDSSPELVGEVHSAERRSKPARMVEDEGAFTNMYSFNERTAETPADMDAEYDVKRVAHESRLTDSFTFDVVGVWEYFVTPLDRVRTLRVE